MYATLVLVLIVSIVLVNLVCCNEQQRQSNEEEIRHALSKLRRWEHSTEDRIRRNGSRQDFDWKRNRGTNKHKRWKEGRNSTKPGNRNIDRLPDRRQVERSVPEERSINRPQPIPLDNRERALPKDQEFNRAEEKPEETPLLERPEVIPVAVPSPPGQRRITFWSDRLDLISN